MSDSDGYQSCQRAQKTQRKRQSGEEEEKEELRRIRHRVAQRKYKQRLKKARLELQKTAETAVAELNLSRQILIKKDNLIQEMRAIIEVQKEELQQLKELNELHGFPTIQATDLNLFALRNSSTVPTDKPATCRPTDVKTESWM